MDIEVWTSEITSLNFIFIQINDVLKEMKKRMGSQKAYPIIGMLLVITVAAPTLGLTFISQTIAPPVQLDLNLVLQSTSNNLKYSANYQWKGDEIEETSSKVSWESDTASASVTSTDQLSEAIKSYFEDILISFNYMLIDDTGDWSFELTKDLTYGIALGVEIKGDRSTIKDITPSLTVSYVPSSLATALRSVGVDEVRVDVKISFHIKGTIIEDFAKSFGIVIGFYAGFLQKTVDVSLETISAITD